MASSQLLAAQEKLEQLRTEAKFQKNNAVPWHVETGDDTAVSITDLPNHLGWGSTAVTQTLRYAQARREKKLNEKASVAETITVMHDTWCVNENVHESRITHHAKNDFVTHHPSLGIAALQQGDVPNYRVWLLCRYLDEIGRGAIDVSLLKTKLTDTASPLRLFSWKRLRQILYAGNGRFWHWHPHNDQLWLMGVAKVAQALTIPKLRSKPIQLPIKEMTAGIGQFKAHLYAAWHSGRRSDNPISREAQRRLTHIPERTQRRYGRMAKVKTTKNIAIGGRLSAEALENEAWQRGNAVFVYKDKAGQFGTKNGRYLAWQLPNQYEGPHQQAQSGRQRKINKQLKQAQKLQLKDLVEIGAQGNRENKDVDRLYHSDGANAVKALHNKSEAYWPTRQKRQTQFWAMIQGKS